ncbi:MAG: FtsX-like permease family protein [Bacteroidota bacterium]
MRSNVNNSIALTHLVSNKRQTFIASLGVTVGIALYIFSNSIVVGVNSFTTANMFKTIPHLRIHKEDKLSAPIRKETKAHAYLISNPKITTLDKTINNPYGLAEKVRQFPFVLNVAPQVDVDLFYVSGVTQINGMASGISVVEADAMFKIQETMLTGNIQQLSTDLNGIIIGRGVAEKLNLRLGDNISILSALGVNKILQVIGVFATDNKAVDDTKSYINIKTAQQLIKKEPNSITDINVQLANPDSSAFYAAQLQPVTDYMVEDWKVAHADQLAQSKLMGTMTPMIAYSILLVAAFGIYNIINMIISQKMNDIAILQATGFNSRNILQIFLVESLVMGIIGTFLGVLIGGALVSIAKGIYVGPPVGYFPIDYDRSIFISAIFFGLFVSLFAGYFPARKAAKMDPVDIFRD